MEMGGQLHAPAVLPRVKKPQECRYFKELEWLKKTNEKP
jgi:hypothetical protein